MVVATNSASVVQVGKCIAEPQSVGQAHEALVGVVPYLDAAKWGSSPSR